MDENLKNFMINRGIDQTVIEEFQKEKINITTIPLIEDEDLKKFIPHYGDRLALKDFATREGKNERESLLERIRTKYSMKRKIPDINSENRKRSNGKQEPKERMIDIGWHHKDKNKKSTQMRTKQGGGSRSIKIMDNLKKHDILDRAKPLFFPEGVSKLGHSSKFDFDLWDFKCNVIDADLTIRQIYELTGLNRLRFYLSTVVKDLPETISRSDSSESEVEVHRPQKTETGAMTPVDMPLLLFEDDETTPVGTLQEYINIYSIENVDDINVNEHEVISTNHLEPIRLTIHREFVFQEFIDIFKNIPIDVPLEIEMILPSGKKETGLDLGGVYRDCLSEFWETFYIKVTLGDEFKIPYLRHDFKDEDWTAIAKILLKGFKDTNYFPIKIAPAFIEMCLGFLQQESILDSFSKYINPRDWNLIQNALDDFKSVDVSELVDILDPMECKWVIKETNFKQLIGDIAYKEIIQKPMFVIDIWRNVLKDMLNKTQLTELYKTRTPLPKNILPLLEFSEENSVGIFLKRFIRESNNESLENLIRFCTGANMLTDNKIKIEFNSNAGITRSPIGHTCSNSLELSRNYENYLDFRNELNNILRSKIWVMDLV